MIFPWRDIPKPAELAVLREATRWVGCPFSPMGRNRAVGASCSGLVAGVLDALYGLQTPTLLPPVPPDAVRHNKALAQQMVDRMVAAYSLVPADSMEPGDLLAIGSKWPVHVALALSERRIIHSVSGAGVRVSPHFPSDKVLGVYRPPGKEHWK